MCDLDKSFLMVIDDDGNLYKVFLTKVQQIKKEITLSDALKYSSGKKVSFYTFREGNSIQNEEVVRNIGNITSSNIIKSSSPQIINDKSNLKVNLDSGFEISIPFNQPGLQLVEEILTDTTVEKAKTQYPIGSKVSFMRNSQLTTGTITGFNSENYKVSIVVTKDNYSMTIDVPFTDPNLKLVESDSGKQKYTLENDKYRVKYAKYKAKYLLQQKK